MRKYIILNENGACLKKQTAETWQNVVNAIIGWTPTGRQNNGTVAVHENGDTIGISGGALYNDINVGDTIDIFGKLIKK